MKKKLVLVLLVLVAIAASYVCIRWYSYIFARTVKGKILKVERVSPPEAIVVGGSPANPNALFSFAVAIRDEHSVIHTASSEDRQWAVAEPGKCAEARFFPYPPWEFEKAGTYFGARLVHLMDCP